MSPAILIRFREVQTTVLVELKKPEVGKTFDHLLAACGLQKGRYIPDGHTGLPESRLLDRALQGLRRHGDITFDKKSRQWALSEV
jgi:hypothetical protein